MGEAAMSRITASSSSRAYKLVVSLQLLAFCRSTRSRAIARVSSERSGAQNREIAGEPRAHSRHRIVNRHDHATSRTHLSRDSSREERKRQSIPGIEQLIGQRESRRSTSSCFLVLRIAANRSEIRRMGHIAHDSRPDSPLSFSYFVQFSKLNPTTPTRREMLIARARASLANF